MDVLLLLSWVFYYFININGFVPIVAIIGYVIFKRNKKYTDIVLMGILLLFFFMADFYPIFLIPIAISLIFLIRKTGLKQTLIVLLFSSFLYYFFFFATYGAAYTFMSKSFIFHNYLINSLITFSDTSANAIVCIIYIFFILLFLNLNQKGKEAGKTLSIAFLILLIGAFASNAYVNDLNSNLISNITNPDISSPKTSRIIILAVDGGRYDKMLEADTPNIDMLTYEGVLFDSAETIYRTKTEPAFSSLLSGAIPKIHGVKNNLYVGGLKIDALPDFIDTGMYGTVHFKDIAKPDWNVKTVSNLEHYYDFDEELMKLVMMDLKEDRFELYIIDFSFVDLVGHTWGSDSIEYLKAWEKTDILFGMILDQLDESGLRNGTTIIIMADHGQSGMDHGFAIMESEKHIPLIFSGKGIGSNVIDEKVNILDLNPTISYLLGKRYTENVQGRVLLDVLE
ncbi:MAG: alkaline phosphatase family protein [Candidatus Aenigmarchaeota archaeon]|nr:alkaline phosphatase family protein [Candidatus Aenigmarchaeota archaeon]